MDYLLDTHIVYWSLYDKERLPKDIVEIIEDERNNIYISSISIWEISLKHLKNPRTMVVSGTEFYQDCLDNNYLILPFLAKDIIDYESIKVKEGKTVNKDPFDRMIIAIARHQNCMLCTCDKRMNYYDDSRILVFG